MGRCTIGYGSVLEAPKIEECNEIFLKQTIHDGQVMYKLKLKNPRENIYFPLSGLSETVATKYMMKEIHYLQEPILQLDKKITVPLLQNQVDALIDLLFNSGDALTDELASAINTRNMKAFYSELLTHIYDNDTHEEMPILKDRRNADMNLFWCNDYKTNTVWNGNCSKK
jgi:GH24 family phage-related lysozyme (muramidase)